MLSCSSALIIPPTEDQNLSDAFIRIALVGIFTIKILPLFQLYCLQMFEVKCMITKVATTSF